MIKITNVECLGNDEWLRDVKCSLKPLKNRSIQIQGSAFATKPMKTIKVHFETQRWHNGFRPFIVDFWSDFCDIISNPKKMNTLMKPFYKLITTYTTLKGPCPIEGSIEIPPTVPDLSVIPSMLVTGIYRLIITAKERDLDEFLFQIKIKAEVTSALKE
ncbi:uncharacterized protein LOC119651453 [Hermetia illucens]|uniref:uncharacterized protein LOC119651453 n=1 Tax=Hermetia illucens TaxID=343691 RepID=UPI0018CBFEB3|nr:uncharacterized protein LOC119651453 [Hermetia illucens]